MFKQTIFELTHLLFDKDFLRIFNEFQKDEFLDYQELKYKQEKQLSNILIYSYKNVPFYRDSFNSLSIIPSDIKKIEDLRVLPIITKDIINKNQNSFIPTDLNKQKYIAGKTGGTTGTPLLYRISREQRIRSIVALYNGFSRAGYKFGDKIIFLGGTSISGNQSSLKKIIYKNIFKFNKLSSFDMEEANLKNYYQTIINYNPKFLRGYPSGIYFLAKWIKEKKLVPPFLKSVFTTSEKLHSYMREEISNVFQCQVFDQYGLGDCGCSAYECEKHIGLHISTDISISEVLDDNNQQITNGEGRIIGTSLYNYSFPFIRYDTGDYAIISDKECSCGRKTKVLSEITGRSVDFLITPEGKNIHGWFFLYIFWEYCKGVKKYQVIQEDLENIRIKIVKDIEFDNSQIEIIKNIVKERSAGWILNFEFVEKIETTQNSKFKFIINKLLVK